MPWFHAVAERDHALQNPTSGEKIRRLGELLRLGPDSRVLDNSKRFGQLYRGSSSVEREFGRLKHEYGLGPLRVRGLAKVALHADLTKLARLSLALARARVPFAA